MRDRQAKEEIDSGQYEQFCKVEKNDFILDLGCSEGYFFLRHRDKPGIQYIGVDGSILCLRDFIRHVGDHELPSIINAFISDKKGLVKHSWSGDDPNFVATISFKDLIDTIGFNLIHFLKFDIEGGERNILIDHYDLFKRSVKKFSGEMHFNFEHFPREEAYGVLDKMINDENVDMKLFSVDGMDITEHFFNNKDYYHEIIMSGYCF